MKTISILANGNKFRSKEITIPSTLSADFYIENLVEQLLSLQTDNIDIILYDSNGFGYYLYHQKANIADWFKSIDEFYLLAPKFFKAHELKKTSLDNFVELRIIDAFPQLLKILPIQSKADVESYIDIKQELIEYDFKNEIIEDYIASIDDQVLQYYGGDVMAMNADLEPMEQQQAIKQQLVETVGDNIQYNIEGIIQEINDAGGYKDDDELFEFLEVYLDQDDIYLDSVVHPVMVEDYNNIIRTIVMPDIKSRLTDPREYEKDTTLGDIEDALNNIGYKHSVHDLIAEAVMDNKDFNPKHVTIPMIEESITEFLTNNGYYSLDTKRIATFIEDGVKEGILNVRKLEDAGMGADVSEDGLEFNELEQIISNTGYGNEDGPIDGVKNIKILANIINQTLNKDLGHDYLYEIIRKSGYSWDNVDFADEDIKALMNVLHATLNNGIDYINSLPLTENKIEEFIEFFDYGWNDDAAKEEMKNIIVNVLNSVPGINKIGANENDELTQLLLDNNVIEDESEVLSLITEIGGEFLSEEDDDTTIYSIDNLKETINNYIIDNAFLSDKLDLDGQETFVALITQRIIESIQDIHPGTDFTYDEIPEIDFVGDETSVDDLNQISLDLLNDEFINVAELFPSNLIKLIQDDNTETGFSDDVYQTVYEKFIELDADSDIFTDKIYDFMDYVFMSYVETQPDLDPDETNYYITTEVFPDLTYEWKLESVISPRTSTLIYSTSNEFNENVVFEDAEKFANILFSKYPGIKIDIYNEDEDGDIEVEIYLRRSEWDTNLNEAENYSEFFTSKLEKFGVNSPDELDDNKKKDFFNEVDQQWKAQDELDQSSCNQEEILDKINEAQDYREFFTSKLEKFGVNSPAELDDDKKKDFFNEVDQQWKAQDELDQSCEQEKISNSDFDNRGNNHKYRNR